MGTDGRLRYSSYFTYHPGVMVYAALYRSRVNFRCSKRIIDFLCVRSNPDIIDSRYIKQSKIILISEGRFSKPIYNKNLGCGRIPSKRCYLYRIANRGHLFIDKMNKKHHMSFNVYWVDRIKLRYFSRS